MNNAVDSRRALGALVATLALSAWGCGPTGQADGDPSPEPTADVALSGLSDIDSPPKDAPAEALVDEGPQDPQEIVPTPFGPMARKCLTRVAPGSIIEADGAVTTATGARVLPAKRRRPRRRLR
jgi:hypothetical protein